jgi:hypothetical protein
LLGGLGTQKGKAAWDALAKEARADKNPFAGRFDAPETMASDGSRHRRSPVDRTGGYSEVAENSL